MSKKKIPTLLLCFMMTGALYSSENTDDIKNALFKAVDNGDAVTLESLLQEATAQSYINTLYEDHDEIGHEYTTSLLLKAVMRFDWKLTTLKHYPSLREQLSHQNYDDVLALLLAHGASPNEFIATGDGYFMSPIHKAVDIYVYTFLERKYASKEYSKLINLLRAHGGNLRNSIDVIFPSIGTSPLIYACQKGLVEEVQQLIDWDVDIRGHSKSTGSSSFLHWIPTLAKNNPALKTNYILILRMLIKAGASGLLPVDTPIIYEDRGGMTPLMTCAEDGNFLFAQELLAAGADTTRKDNEEKTALHHCCRGTTNRTERLLVAQLLLQKYRPQQVTLTPMEEQHNE